MYSTPSSLDSPFFKAATTPSHELSAGDGHLGLDDELAFFEFVVQVDHRQLRWSTGGAGLRAPLGLVLIPGLGHVRLLLNRIVIREVRDLAENVIRIRVIEPANRLLLRITTRAEESRIDAALSGLHVVPHALLVAMDLLLAVQLVITIIKVSRSKREAGEGTQEVGALDSRRWGHAGKGA